MPESARHGRRLDDTSDLAVVKVSWEELPAGYESTWSRTVTQEAVNGYCDGVDDRNPWYGPDRSPFGPPVAPPLFVAHWCKDTLKPFGALRDQPGTASQPRDR